MKTQTMRFSTYGILRRDGGLVMHTRWPTLPMCFPTRKGAAEEAKGHDADVRVVRMKIEAAWRSER